MSSFHIRDDGTMVFLVHLTFKSEQDAELIKFVRECPRRLLATNIRELLRAGQLNRIKPLSIVITNQIRQNE